ncbi:MAG: hypothetical protein CVU11_11750 [Bacteroidetes bacterium HGW-Bacteroidetes-6]|jgi:ATP-dependent exoDNAse (exonuclease V) beta subunit|nr:MAG: hypothetical protein CVU11_11750 [Bacteroidetes bacterium HGW-Bacteroidetes-6]
MPSLTLLNASAGSGKTQRIALEFMKQILPNPSESARILAITFTNRAAAEMKSRLIESLATLSDDPSKSKMLKGLLDTFPNWDNEILQQKAHTALTYLLHHYSDISVSTIDSFMQRIIRTFARDLKLPMNFEVMVGEKELSELIISTLIDNANLDKNITLILKQIIALQIEEERSPLRLTDYLLPVTTHLSNEASTEITAAALHNRTDSLITAFNRLKAKVAKTDAIIEQKKIDFQQFLAEKKLLPNDFKIKNRVSIYSYYTKLVNNQEIKKGKTISAFLESGGFLVNADSDTESVIIEKLFEIERFVTDRKFARLLYSRFPVVALMGEIWRFREAYKTENSILPVSDFNRIIRSVLSKEPIPFIYLRAGSRYKTIMIDEFQDTSLMQWLNLLPLVSESLAKGQNSWLVGDPKQSIYRWRNGQVEIMLNLPVLYGAGPELFFEAEQIGNSFRSEVMESNYRSLKNIVDFNNSFYQFMNSVFAEKISGNEDNNIYKQLYSDVEQKAFHEKPGYVECRFYEGKLNAQLTGWLNDIKNQIQDCVRHGFQLSDIAILTRDIGTGVKVSSYLMSLDEPIPVISRETLQFQTSPHCRLIMCTFRLIHRPDDELNAAELWFLLNQPGMESIKNRFADFPFYAHSQKGNSGAVLQKKMSEQFARLNEQQLRFMLPSDQIDIIINELNIAKTGGFFLLFLREEIFKQQDKTGSDYEKLWAWWNNNGKTTSVVVPDAGNAVNVMTIHSSKGLQFPVVIVPSFNINEASKVHKNLFWFETNEEEWGIPYSIISLKKEVEDQRLEKITTLEYTKSHMDSINLMYVATTRAEQNLFIFAMVPEKVLSGEKQTDGSESWLYHFCSNESRIFKHEKKENFLCFSLGESTDAIYKKENESNSFLIDSFSVNPNKPLDSLRKSEKQFDTTEYRIAAKQGRVIHELLAEICSTDDIEKMVEKFVANGFLEAETANGTKQFLNNIAKQYPYAFPGKAFTLNERDIADNSGNIYRPDRMVFDSQNRWKIIDFKTGNQVKEHKKQVEHYANLLSESGSDVESAHIFYIDINAGAITVVDVI